MITWQQRAAILADELVDQGRLRSPEWIKAVRAVPRHILVPHYYEYDHTAGTWKMLDSAHDDLEKIYSNTGLYTKVGDGSNDMTPSSSTSTPGLMTRMLEMLHIRDSDRVLEIGTGTGYNAALLSHRLGDAQVFSIDIDAELVELARERLAGLGYHPTLTAADGAEGMIEHAPFDRIIATCAVPAVPWAWIAQVTDGGLVLVDIKRGIAAGNLITLHRHGHYAEGRFDPRWANFMSIRRPGDQPAPRPTRNRNHVKSRPTTIADPPWEQPTWWFLASLTMPRGIVYGRTLSPNGQPADMFLEAPDGSWADIAPATGNDSEHLVWEGGDTPLWHLVEQAHQLWRIHQQPEWQRFGLTITPTSQHVWLDDSTKGPRWPLDTP